MDDLRLVQTLSPNQEPRSKGGAVDILVLHYTDTVDAASALEILCDPARKVSAHYLIEESGVIHSLVPESQCAWHAGISFWDGATNINDRSIGIELVNPGHLNGYRPFPAVQIEALIALSKGILSRHKIPPQRVLGHSDVAPQRKKDPGELFPWQRLAMESVAIWPNLVMQRRTLSSIAILQAKLAAFGYAVPQSGVLDDETRHVVLAFQRRFRPYLLSGL
ncbi:MAG: N-acetylmuramoyl-L-alanine amidase, partial [Alphaproteobacteria bacterium]